MYKLYNVKAWGSMCVHFLLEEMDVPYTNIWMTAGTVGSAGIPCAESPGLYSGPWP